MSLEETARPKEFDDFDALISGDPDLERETRRRLEVESLAKRVGVVVTMDSPKPKLSAAQVKEFLDQQAVISQKPVPDDIAKALAEAPSVEMPIESPVTDEHIAMSELISDNETTTVAPSTLALIGDDELRVLINNREDTYFAHARTFRDADERLAELQKAFDATNAEQIALKKKASEDKAAAAVLLQEAALEYRRRNPKETRFDNFVEFKEFNPVEIDIPKCLQWCEDNYKTAIVTGIDTIDVKAIEAHVKTLKAQKKPLPEWAKLKPRVDCQISKKLPPGPDDPQPTLPEVK